MESRNTILQELNMISEEVAGLPSTTPYVVPAGYFENLAGNILLKIGLSENSPVLNSITRSNVYQLPNGYFDSLANEIMKRIRAEESGSAKDELSILSPVLSRLEKKIPYTVPEGYFDEFRENVVDGMKAVDYVNEELENLSAVMNTLKHKNVYEVPPGYFENLPAQIMDKVKKQKPALVVSSLFRKRMVRFAAAAMVAGLVIISAIFFINKQSSTNTLIVGVNAEKEAQEKVKTVTDTEIINYLEDQTEAVDDNNLSTASSEVDGEDMREILADVPDEELQEYVAQFGETKQVLTN